MKSSSGIGCLAELAQQRVDAGAQGVTLAEEHPLDAGLEETLARDEAGRHADREQRLNDASGRGLAAVLTAAARSGTANRAAASRRTDRME